MVVFPVNVILLEVKVNNVMRKVNVNVNLELLANIVIDALMGLMDLGTLVVKIVNVLWLDLSLEYLIVFMDIACVKRALKDRDVIVANLVFTIWILKVKKDVLLVSVLERLHNMLKESRSHRAV